MITITLTDDGKEAHMKCTGGDIVQYLELLGNAAEALRDKYMEGTTPSVKFQGGLVLDEEE